ncbi:hypothetical protein HDV02_000696, partial [Globomyces sp. JEL0801]
LKKNKIMRIICSDSEPEELETVVVHSQASTVTTPEEEEVIVKSSRRDAVAWLCFNKEAKYQ